MNAKRTRAFYPWVALLLSCHAGCGATAPGSSVANTGGVGAAAGGAGGSSGAVGATGGGGGVTVPDVAVILFLIDGVTDDAVRTAAASGATNLAYVLANGTRVETA